MKMELAETLPYACNRFLDRLWHCYITLADVEQLGIFPFLSLFQAETQLAMQIKTCDSF